MSTNTKLSLSEFVPAIKNVWNSKNGDLTPDMVNMSDRTKVYIDCPCCGKTRCMQAANAWKINKNGKAEIRLCVVCGGKKAREADTRYAHIVCPEFKDWWDNEKNQWIDMKQVTVRSKNYYYFTCPECKDTFRRTTTVLLKKINDHLYQVNPCQKCHPTQSSLKVMLTTAVPDIYYYWNFEQNNFAPENLGASASTKVYTICPVCDKSVLRSVRYSWKKDANGIGHIAPCKACGKMNDSNSLIKLFPGVRDYWNKDNPYPPDCYTISSGKKVKLLCPDCGEPQIRPICESIAQNDDGKYYVCSCVDCSRVIKTSKYWQRTKGSLADTCPEIKTVWADDRFRPEDLLSSSKEIIRTRCPICDKIIERKCVNTIKYQDGQYSIVPCHMCGITLQLKQKSIESSILKVYPEIENWWNYGTNSLFPDEVFFSSKQRIRLTCPEYHHDFEYEIRHFVNQSEDGTFFDIGCPYCMSPVEYRLSAMAA